MIERLVERRGRGAARRCRPAEGQPVSPIQDVDAVQPLSIARRTSADVRHGIVDGDRVVLRVRPRMWMVTKSMGPEIFTVAPARYPETLA